MKLLTKFTNYCLVKYIIFVFFIFNLLACCPPVENKTYPSNVYNLAIKFTLNSVPIPALYNFPNDSEAEVKLSNSLVKKSNYFETYVRNRNENDFSNIIVFEFSEEVSEDLIDTLYLNIPGYQVSNLDFRNLKKEAYQRMPNQPGSTRGAQHQYSKSNVILPVHRQPVFCLLRQLFFETIMPSANAFSCKGSTSEVTYRIGTIIDVDLKPL